MFPTHSVYTPFVHWVRVLLRANLSRIKHLFDVLWHDILRYESGIRWAHAIGAKAHYFKNSPIGHIFYQGRVCSVILAITLHSSYSGQAAMDWLYQFFKELFMIKINNVFLLFNFGLSLLTASVQASPAVSVLTRKRCSAIVAGMFLAVANTGFAKAKKYEHVTAVTIPDGRHPHDHFGQFFAYKNSSISIPFDRCRPEKDCSISIHIKHDHEKQTQDSFIIRSISENDEIPIKDEIVINATCTCRDRYAQIELHRLSWREYFEALLTGYWRGTACTVTDHRAGSPAIK